MHIRLLCSLLIFLGTSFSLMGQRGDIFIKASQFYDSEKNVLLRDKAIRVQGIEIAEILDFQAIPDGAEIIDLTDYTVLPGLIDAHTHVLFSQYADVDFAEHSIHTLVMESDALRALRGAKRARSYLDVGITSIKDLGNSGQFLDVALRDAINEGSTAGPRIFASGPILAATGGQIYGVLPAHQHIIDGEYRIVKGREDAVNAVREHVNQGVDLIKICADNLPNRTLLSVNEIKAITETAHTYGLTVTAHCVTDQSAWNAITAGVDGIEHGFNIADTTLVLMAKKQVYLVPTENSRDYMETYARLAGYADDERDWIEYYMNNMEGRLERAIAKGVTIVAGSDNYTDIGVSAGQSSIDMLRAYVEAGMKPLDILQSATFLAAKSMKKEQSIGSLSPGAFADIIAVRGDLEQDFLATMDRVVFVMKDGAVYLDGRE
ncbi:MAG: amidohydrolase family protein [Cryomorphaceae bacterium]